MASPVIRVIVHSEIIAGVETIFLSQESYEHIIENHTMMGFPTFESAIIACVTSSATSVHKSRTNPRSLVYVDAQSTNIHGEPLRVAVKRMENSTGYVTTALFASSKSPGPLIWRKPE